jgi:hypothetical protein
MDQGVVADWENPQKSMKRSDVTDLMTQCKGR